MDLQRCGNSWQRHDRQVAKVGAAVILTARGKPGNPGSFFWEAKAMKRVNRAVLLAGVAVLMMLVSGVNPAAAASIDPHPVPAGWYDSDLPSDSSITSPFRIFLPAVAAPDHALDIPANLFPSLDEFTAQVSDGLPGQVRGVYVPDVLALPVLQQPEDQPYHVFPTEDTITQFQSAADFGVTGLLAHNYLAGTLFYDLAPGQEVFVVTGGGKVRHYRVNEVIQYQALDPFSSSSPLVDLSTGEKHTFAQVFLRVYAGGDKVTFQTCIDREGNAAWGRYFVTAAPVTG
jgi:hypothetical protein